MTRQNQPKTKSLKGFVYMTSLQLSYQNILFSNSLKKSANNETNSRSLTDKSIFFISDKLFLVVFDFKLYYHSWQAGKLVNYNYQFQI